MKQYSNLLAILLIILIIISCKEDNPVHPPEEVIPAVTDTLTTSVEQVTHRSISVNVKTTDYGTGKLIELRRFDGTSINENYNLVTSYTANVLDTTIIDNNDGNGLELDTEYGYYAVRLDSLNMPKDSSNIVTAKTFAATSHKYDWQEIVLGEFQSTLYDVWGTDENNIYAVGSIRLNDTLYGIIKWNGTEWLPEKKVGGVNAIFGFYENDIWAVGGAVEHYNGNEWKRIDAETINYRDQILDSVLYNNSTYTSIWGKSSSNLYFTGANGKIIHWNGNKASIDFEAEEGILEDIDGYSNEYIISVGTPFIPPSLTVFYNGNTWSNIPDIDNNYSMHTVTIINKKEIYFGGDGVFVKKGKQFTRTYSPGYAIFDLEYNQDTGEIIAAGPYDGVYIFNGLEWINHRQTASNDGSTYAGIYTYKDYIYCVGIVNTSAKILIGKKKEN